MLEHAFEVQSRDDIVERVATAVGDAACVGDETEEFADRHLAIALGAPSGT
ncbi:MAG: hypothetical protein U1F23_02775 [Lysobacterales bacterium]